MVIQQGNYCLSYHPLLCHKIVSTVSKKFMVKGADHERIDSQGRQRRRLAELLIHEDNIGMCYLCAKQKVISYCERISSPCRFLFIEGSTITLLFRNTV